MNAQSTMVVEGHSASAFDRLKEHGVSLAIWQRSVPRRLAQWLDALPPERLPQGRFAASPLEAPSCLTAICDLAELRPSPQRDALIADIVELICRFARLTVSARVDVRLEAVDHDSCWRFHRDQVGLRLNATYRGPGTQWPPLDKAEQAIRNQRRYRGALNELPRFAVGLFKGVTLAGRDSVVHRSPPIAGRGLTRLFLCLNEERAYE